jgi:hypothetical protein
MSVSCLLHVRNFKFFILGFLLNYIEEVFGVLVNCKCFLKKCLFSFYQDIFSFIFLPCYL